MTDQTSELTRKNRQASRLAKYKKAIMVLSMVFFGLAGMFYNHYRSVDEIGRGGIYTDTGSAPQATVAVVLGARVYPDGRVSPVLADRLTTGVELYKAGKVEKLLLTGDHGQTNYDEVNSMRQFVLDLGVPEEDVFMDHAGFSTYDSMYRARDVFQVQDAIIVTQQFHLPRALYIARELGLEANGVVADKRPYAGADYLEFRETLARVKAILQLQILKSEPKYLGEAIPISGDGRVTRDKI